MALISQASIGVHLKGTDNKKNNTQTLRELFDLIETELSEITNLQCEFIIHLPVPTAQQQQLYLQSQQANQLSYPAEERNIRQAGAGASLAPRIPTSMSQGKLTPLMERASTRTLIVRETEEFPTFVPLPVLLEQFEKWGIDLDEVIPDVTMVDYTGTRIPNKNLRFEVSTPFNITTKRQSA